MTDSETEAKHILELCKGDSLRAFEMIQGQLAVLVLRTQVMLSLSLDFALPNRWCGDEPESGSARA